MQQSRGFHAMNALVFRFTVACCLVLPLNAAEPPTIKPGSEEWRMVYEPAFEKPTELDADSELRKSLFNLLRPRAEKIAKQAVKFQGNLRVYRNWAFFSGSSVDANGKPVEYPELGNSDTVALWHCGCERSTAGSWSISPQDTAMRFSSCGRNNMECRQSC
jgi:hypothetical protein